MKTYSILTINQFVFAYLDKDGNMTKSQLNNSRKQGYDINYFVNKEEAEKAFNTVSKLIK